MIYREIIAFATSVFYLESDHLAPGIVNWNHARLISCVQSEIRFKEIDRRRKNVVRERFNLDGNKRGNKRFIV